MKYMNHESRIVITKTGQKRFYANKAFWADIDWTKSNSQISKELGCTSTSVARHRLGSRLNKLYKVRKLNMDAGQMAQFNALCLEYKLKPIVNSFITHTEKQELMDILIRKRAELVQKITSITQDIRAIEDYQHQMARAENELRQLNNSLRLGFIRRSGLKKTLRRLGRHQPILAKSATASSPAPVAAPAP